MAKSLKTLLFGRWSWRRPFVSIAVIYVILAIFAYFFSPHLIFPAPQNASYTVEEKGFFTLTTSHDEEIACLYKPAKDNKPTILASHGNAEDMGNFRHLFTELTELGYGLLVYDYPGYGLSGGTPSEKGCYRAIDLAWRHLTQSLGISEKNILIIGRSVGSGPSTWLAAKSGKNAQALVLLSPFTSTFRTVTKVPLFLGDRFPNIDHIRDIKAPVLILHGEQDRVIPISHGQALHEAATASEYRLFVPLKNVGHNDLTSAWRKIIYEILYFTTQEQTL